MLENLENGCRRNRASQAEASAISLSTRLQRMTPEEEGSDVREMVWEIQAVLMQSAILFQGGN